MRMISKAIRSLCPTAEFTLEDEDYSTIKWIITPDYIPNLEELHTELDRIELLELNNQYQLKRKYEYPRIESQLDMLWHMMDDGTIPGKNSIWYNAILEIKQKYPKQE